MIQTETLKERQQEICVDGQVDFVTGTLPNHNFEKKLGYVANRIHNAIRPVVFTKDKHYSNYMETLEGKNLPVPHCIVGTPGFEIVKELLDACTKTPIIVEKETFGYTDWKEIFGLAEDIDEFVIYGTVNPICPFAQAVILRACYPNKKITMDFGGCGFMADENGDETKCREAVKYILKMQQIDVINEDK